MAHRIEEQPLPTTRPEVAAVEIPGFAAPLWNSLCRVHLAGASLSFVVRDRKLDAANLNRPVSRHRNFATEAGLGAIETALGRFRGAHRPATDKGDKQAAAAVLREVRYWRTRRANAEVVKPSADKSQASFGMIVALRRNDSREESFRIVGEDEADPSRGTVSYVSPLARAVLTHGRAEAVEIAGQEAVVFDVREEGL